MWLAAMTRRDCCAVGGTSMTFSDFSTTRALGALDAIGADGVVDLVADIDGQRVAAEFTATKRPLCFKKKGHTLRYTVKEQL